MLLLFSLSFVNMRVRAARACLKTSRCSKHSTLHYTTVEGFKMKKSNILIITGGQVSDHLLTAILQKKQYSMIIAADHGLAAADRLNIALDYIVGDFDSVPVEVLEKYKKLGTPIKTFPREKDQTDTQIALEFAIQQQPERIDIIGATGSRLDHVLGNIHLLLSPMQQNIIVNILDSNNRIYLMKESFSLKKKEQYGNYVSFLPFTQKVTGLTLKGFKYPLYNIIYPFGSSLGISNEIVEEEAFVELSEGILIVIESRD